MITRVNVKKDALKYFVEQLVSTGVTDAVVSRDDSNWFVEWGRDTQDKPCPPRPIPICETLQELVTRLGLKPADAEIMQGRERDEHGYSWVLVKRNNTYMTIRRPYEPDNFYTSVYKVRY